MSRPLREPSSRNGRLSAALLLAAGACVALAPGAARADDGATAGPSAARAASEPLPPVTPRVALRYSLWGDVSATAGLAVGTFVFKQFQDDIAPGSCNWCDGSAPGKVNAVDDFFRTAFKRADTKPADTVSNVLAYGLAPAAAVGLGGAAAAADRRFDEAPLNTLLVAEATLSAIAADEVMKVAFARERPYVHALEGDAKAEALAKGDGLVSFPSGHTAATFAMAASAGTIATMRGYRLAPLVWIAGAMLGVGTGYLRMAADKHYFTDVIGGAVLGTGLGIGVPLLFHRPRPANDSSVARLLHGAQVSTSSVPGGRMVSVGWAF